MELAVLPFLRENVRKSMPSWNSLGSNILDLKSSLGENVSDFFRSHQPVQGTYFKIRCLLLPSSSEDPNSFGNWAEKKKSHSNVRVQVKCLWQLESVLFSHAWWLFLKIFICFSWSLLMWPVFGSKIRGRNLVEYHSTIFRVPNSSHCFFLS